MIRSIAIASTLFFLSALSVHAGPVDIRATTIQLKQQQMGVGLDILSKHIKEKLGNKVRFRVYPAAQLYSGKEELEAIMKGEDQMAYVIGSVFEQVDSANQLYKLPFLFPDIDIAYKVIDGPVGKKMFARLEQKGITVLGYTSSGAVAIHNSKHPLIKPEDFKGLKMRSFGPIGAACIKALGSIAVVSVPEEMYTAFQQGMLDGGATPNTVFFQRRLYDVQKYVTDAGMLNFTLGFLIVSTKWWKSLPPDIRAGVNDAVAQTIREQRADLTVQEKKLWGDIAAKGCNVYHLTKADQAAWKKVLQPVYTQFTPQIGPDLVKEAERDAERIEKGHK